MYLAQVSHHPQTQAPQLKLLAQKQSDYTWVLMPETSLVEISEPSLLTDQGLVLVELSDDQQVQTLQDAIPWLLDLIREYLGIGVTPTFLRQETERAEEWRKTLTLQSQELGRRTLELEARLGQIQELEEQLKQKLQGNEPPEEV